MAIFIGGKKNGLEQKKRHLKAFRRWSTFQFSSRVLVAWLYKFRYLFYVQIYVKIPLESYVPISHTMHVMRSSAEGTYIGGVPPPSGTDDLSNLKMEQVDARKGKRSKSSKIGQKRWKSAAQNGALKRRLVGGQSGGSELFFVPIVYKSNATHCKNTEGMTLILCKMNGEK